jgi:hypothetical protein
MQRTLNQFRSPKPIVAPPVQDLQINKPISIETALNQNEQTMATTSKASDTNEPTVAKKRRAKKKQQKKVLENLIEEAIKIKPFLDDCSTKNVLGNTGNQITMSDILDRIKKEKSEQDITIEKLRRTNGTSKQGLDSVNTNVTEITNFIDSEPQRGKLI